MAYILETQNLTKIYGHKEAVKDVNLHIREGQIYGLIGRNGAARQPDGSLRLNTEIKDVKGRDFPYQYLSELMEPELFSLPTGMN